MGVSRVLVEPFFEDANALQGFVQFRTKFANHRLEIGDHLVPCGASRARRNTRQPIRIFPHAIGIGNSRWRVYRNPWPLGKSLAATMLPW